MVGRLLAVAVIVVAVVSLDPEEVPMVPAAIGFSNTWAATGLTGTALALTAMRGSPLRMKWPLGVAAAAGISIAGSVWVVPIFASDPSDILFVLTAWASSIVMMVSAAFALVFSLMPPLRGADLRSS